MHSGPARTASGELRAAATALHDVRGQAEGLMLACRSSCARRSYAQASEQMSCPVCGSATPLDGAWQSATATRLNDIDATAARAKAIETRARAREVRAQYMHTGPANRRAREQPRAWRPRRLSTCWSDWATRRSAHGPEALAAHLGLTGAPMLARAGRLREAATQRPHDGTSCGSPFRGRSLIGSRSRARPPRPRLARSGWERPRNGSLRRSRPSVKLASPRSRRARLASGTPSPREQRPAPGHRVDWPRQCQKRGPEGHRRSEGGASSRSAQPGRAECDDAQPVPASRAAATQHPLDSSSSTTRSRPWTKYVSTGWHRC